MANPYGRQRPETSNMNNEDPGGHSHPQRPTLTREPSVIQAFTHFIGVGTNREVDNAAIEEQNKWDKKRLRLISKKYSLKNSEVEKFVRNLSSSHDQTHASSSMLSPDSPVDVERGTSRAFIQKTPTQVSRVPLVAAASLPSQLHDQSTQSLDQSRLSKTRISSKDTRESVPSALLSTLGSFIKKGTLVDKSRLKMMTMFSSKNSFDIDSMLTPEDSTPPAPTTPDDENSSPAGIVFGMPFPVVHAGSKKKSFAPAVSPKSKREFNLDVPESVISEIPEETSFEVEVAERGDIDETEESVFDETAEDRMKRKVRKKSSARLPPVFTDKSSSLVLERESLDSKPQRPCDLSVGAKPLYEDQVLAHLASISDEHDGDNAPPPSSLRFRGKRPAPHLPINRSISLVDEVFFDDNVEPPEIVAYHHDIAPSPPTSAQLNRAEMYSFDAPVRYRQEAGITYIDIGDSNIVQPKKTSLAPIVGPSATSFQPDRPRMDSASRNPLIRQGTIDDMNVSPAMKKQRKTEFLNAKSNEYKNHLKAGHRKRQRGMGFFARIGGSKLKTDKLSKKVREIIDEEADERTWFTYWVTSIQFLVCFFSVILYGFGQFGVGMAETKGEVLDTSLTFRRVSFKEPMNIWLGPRYADLIHLGAKYTPCMRYEEDLWKEIESDRTIENRTGCCIANDKSGCYQTSESICPSKVARWVRWDKQRVRPPMLERKSKSESDLWKGLSPPSSSFTRPSRKSGAVCGQDPDYCEKPHSTGTDVWPDDITKWPICEKRHEGFGMPAHMTCRITGRPCCIQLQGLCRIATKEYCDFVNGQYHENATLCSQVNCFKGVCGMFPFFREHPNQFYRLFISLFIHAGIIHFCITACIQMFIMRDMEKLIGPYRMGILYLVSGIGGNLASAIFVPYYPDVGPSGAHFGILASYFVDIYHHRALIEDVKSALFQYFIITIILLFCGIAPFVDNWAHMFGFIFGLLTTIVTFPYIDFNDNDGKSNGDAQRSGLRVAITPTSAVSSPMNTVVVRADTPLSTDGYSQLANGIPHSTTAPPTVFSAVFHNIRKFATVFMTKRSYYVILALTVEISIFLLLVIVFMGFIKFKCDYCIYLNCIPGFCENQGQKLFKWLPI